MTQGKIGQAYKAKVLAWIGQHVEGVETVDLRAKFPRVPLLEMEREGTVAYENERWVRVGQDK